MTPTQELPNVGYWKPPDQGRLKLNIDGTIFTDLQTTKIDAMLRNNKGEVINGCQLKREVYPISLNH